MAGNGTFYSTGTLPQATLNQDGSVTFDAVNSKWYGFNNFKAPVPADAKYFVFTVSLSEAKYCEFKVDADNNPYHEKRMKETINGKTTYVIDLEELGCTDPTTLVKACICPYADVAITIYECYFTNVEPVIENKYDLMAGNGTFYSTGTLPQATLNQDGSVTFDALNGKWYGFNAFKAPVPADAKYFVFTVSLSEAKYCEFKVDADNNPYHEKRMKETINGKTTYVIDLEELGCTDPTTLVKACICPYADVAITIYECYFTNLDPRE